MDKNRRKRMRNLLGRLNQQRHQQAAKIDILCNDMVTAHRSFLQKLRNFCFAANFYEAILGKTDSADILNTACLTIANELHDTKVSIFIAQPETFEIYTDNKTADSSLDWRQFEASFDTNVVKAVSRRGKICFLNEMITLGLQATPSFLSQIIAAAIPIGTLGADMGFILLARPAQKCFNSDEIRKISAVTPGLYRALKPHQLQTS